MRQDLVLSLRHLRRSPVFAAAAIVTLALGIGANTAVFTAVNSILFRSMRVEHPEQLVALNRRDRFEVPTYSYPNYRDYRDRNQVFLGLIAYTFAGVSLAQGNDSKIAWGYLVSDNYFDTLGVTPLLGRKDPATYAMALGVMALVALSASWIPVAAPRASIRWSY